MISYRKFIAFQKALKEMEQGNVKDALRYYKVSGVSATKVPEKFH